jgi:hypothetical protein
MKTIQGDEGMSKAISPHELNNAVVDAVQIPDGVIEAINELLIKNGSRNPITLMQSDVLVAITKKMRVTKKTVFDNRWLDFEQLYRKAGWVVSYDAPGYCETYEESWKFTKPDTRL